MNDDERRQWIARWRASGETAAAFGTRHGLTGKQLHQWAYRLKVSGRENRPADLANSATRPVRLVRVLPRRLEEGRPSLEAMSSGIRFSISGAVVHVARGFDEDSLCRVVNVLRRSVQGTP